ncbi:amidohydrolase family protein [Brachybacterium sp. Z12]|uniref:amidohydrolase family protein n=1 Tax=Brachybacterium sp. Z12 TaxID=2759167 RepID=UPI00223BB1AE|nr:amidohydrolase family protein [Brachybacterium sp. Z12]
MLSVGPEALRDALTRAKAQGLSAAVHAIGDAAAQVALDAIRTVGIERARIEHAQMLTDDDIDAMAALGVTASVQPAHLLDDRDATEAVWPGHGIQAFRLRDLLDAGVPLALGSDAPVAPLDPWLAMAAAVHRSADERPGWHPEQQLQPREALAASTDGIASLQVGGVGDVVLLEGDPFADVPLGADGLMVDAAAREAAERLRETAVRETFVAGVPSLAR